LAAALTRVVREHQAVLSEDLLHLEGPSRSALQEEPSET